MVLAVKKSLVPGLMTSLMAMLFGVPMVGSRPPANAVAFTEANALLVASKAFVPCSFALTASTRPSSSLYLACP